MLPKLLSKVAELHVNGSPHLEMMENPASCVLKQPLFVPEYIRLNSLLILLNDS